jgi:hypothetical protein
MSIAICTGMLDPAVRTEDPHRGVVKQVPTADGETDILMRATDGELGKICVSPWPFAAAKIHVACEGALLPPHFDDEPAMRAVLGNVTRVVLSTELRPA